MTMTLFLGCECCGIGARVAKGQVANCQKIKKGCYGLYVKMLAGASVGALPLTPNINYVEFIP